MGALWHCERSEVAPCYRKAVLSRLANKKDACQRRPAQHKRAGCMRCQGPAKNKGGGPIRILVGLPPLFFSFVSEPMIGLQ